MQQLVWRPSTLTQSLRFSNSPQLFLLFTRSLKLCLYYVTWNKNAFPIDSFMTLLMAQPKWIFDTLLLIFHEFEGVGVVMRASKPLCWERNYVVTRQNCNFVAQKWLIGGQAKVELPWWIERCRAASRESILLLHALSRKENNNHASLHTTGVMCSFSLALILRHFELTFLL
jgi:hypothetical protein